MSRDADTQAEEALLLELAQLGMGMARKVHEAAMAATGADQLVALATAFHHTGRGVRQSLALHARFVAGTVAPAPRAETTRTPDQHAERPERDDAYERPDWNERLPNVSPLDDEELAADLETCITGIRRDLTIVSRTPALTAIPALRAPAATLAGRAALLGGASLRLVNTS